MSNSFNVDLVILGGGCAGLSLAKYLSYNPRWRKKTLIIEARTHYNNDRSWCFWEPKTDDLRSELEPLITHRWPKWTFSGNQFSIVHHSEERQYCFIPSVRFYHHAIDCINSHSAMELRSGVEVLSAIPQYNGYLIKLSDGASIFSRFVIDTRPTVYSLSEQSKLWQIFYGVEIKASTPIFDSSCVGLMEELNASTAGTQFVYILPFSAHHALIEWTVFSPQLSAPDRLETRLQEWLSSRFSESPIQIIRTEKAVLPMGLKIAHPSYATPKYIYGGQVAGAIRPATGYAFLRIQRWARDCAKQIAEGKTPKAPRLSPWIARAMDALFLAVLHDQPQRGALLFKALSQHVPPAVLVRFLSDEANIIDYFLVMRALPAKLFLCYSLNITYWFNLLKVKS